MFLKSILTLLLVACSLSAIAKSEKKFKIYLDTKEFYQIHGEELVTGSAFMSGSVDYNIKKFRIKKSGTEEIANKESEEGIRAFEIVSDSEVKMTHLETGISVLIPAIIKRDQDGIVEFIHINGDDYISAIDPLDNHMDNTLFRLAKKKVLNYLPVKIKLKASNLTCKRVETYCCEENEDNNVFTNQLVCSQSHFLKVGM